MSIFFINIIYIYIYILMDIQLQQQIYFFISTIF